ncbi:mannitol-1-phosphate 5-dehydrogenase [Sediminibacillus albus]|uniref:Mannitol-1-phosphate 5-dehydrogenase n=1 Tax=Sediminibacillus albus TaxID=407036 RepID=A0A1G8WT43_9BACI|nr:mannitol-1-phosphate 5-dehydrogenase [Sediminibacillus albus]SDJ81391.1 mannitol-1-phosphate 5-dehydrogenase [Sediminibacillus albus]
MLAVHFGAGNIGRGFIGALLYQAGYHTTFVDVNDQVIQALNEKQQYKVVLAAEESEEVTIKDVSGINSMENPDAVIEAIVHADVVTTAVGPNVLKIISELVAKGLRERVKTNKQPLNLIACENMVGGSTLLKEKVFEQLQEDEKAQFDQLFGFPDAAVDRIVPNQTNEDPLEVSVEPYYEWVVDESMIKGTKPEIDGITYVRELTPYIERKLFTVNTGHAVPAYLGRFIGYSTIKEAMDNKDVQEIVKGALYESGEALIQTYDFNREEHQQYIDKIIKRFLNPYISDEVTRVGRGPIRKLGPKDRLVRPASLYQQLTGKEPEYLAKTIAAALNYQNDHDEEAVKMQALIKEKGYQKALQQVAELQDGDPLLTVVMQQLDEIKHLNQI